MLHATHEHTYARFFYATSTAMVCSKAGWLWERVEYSTKDYSWLGLWGSLPIMKGDGLDAVFMSAILFCLAAAFRPDLRALRAGFAASCSLLVAVQSIYWGRIHPSEILMLLVATFLIFNNKEWFMSRLKSLPIWTVLIPIGIVAFSVFRMIDHRHVSPELLKVLLPFVFLVSLPALQRLESRNQ